MLNRERHRMNALERFIADNNLDGNAVLSWLQTVCPEHPVSDLCLTPAGVASGDAARAVALLVAHRFAG